MKNFKLIQLKKARWVLIAIAILTIIDLFFIHQPTIKATEIKPNPKTTKIYKPRPGRKRTQARKPGGYRGDSCNQSQNPITLLVPRDHVPLTTAQRPTFFWNVNTISQPIRFTIYEPGQPRPIYVQNITPKTPGIIALSLPERAKSLKIGVQYRWTVSVICDRSRPSENIYAKAWIERVESSNTGDKSPVHLRPKGRREASALAYRFAYKTKVPAGDRWSSCLSNYAQSGIWYDALSCQRKSTEEFWLLLNQVKLLAIAKEQPQITFIN
ncbi:MAG: hypothetical protein RLZZ574_1759 [Cyanobacteriota bacterium]|jgi:hypothetical protein